MKHRIHKMISVFTIVTCMLLTWLPIPTFATENVVIPEDAIYISSAEELIELAENCRVNTWSIGKTVVLKEDINLKDVSFEGIPTFGGTFLGCGHVIKNINLVHEGSVVGFFRYLQQTAVVDSLRLEGELHPEGSKSVVGAFAGKNAGTIRNCTFSGDVSGYEQIGGLVGINETSGVIELCKVEGSVHGSHFVGGIVGENHGVIRQTVNESEVNTKSVQNSVELEDITVDNFINTESANTATDIGGIVGISSGVIRECTNHGAVGYQNMGYNVGGIAGSQKGYMVDCINNGEIQGRKEVGGIVGHMEPNLVLEYKEDSFQTLSKQLDELSVTLKEIRNTLDKSDTKLNSEVEALEKDIDKIQEALNIISDELDIETDQEPPKAENSDSEIPNLDEWDSENSEWEDVDYDRVIAAMSDMSESMADAFEKISNILEILSDTSDKLGPQLDATLDELDAIIGTVETMEDNLQFDIVDVSGEDTEEDILGKISNCMNYGKVTGQFNVGGIAGMMADETDLDAIEDIETTGEVSLNGTYRMRVVIRDCKNFGLITADKQYVGGIAGQMIIGAVIESLNMGNLDTIKADYVGGIAGESSAIIRNCGSKCIMAGDTYVGGIVGDGKEVTDCYAFVSMEAYTEKMGAIIGYTQDIPEGTAEDIILHNYYYIAGKDIGGIDGISYTGAVEKLDVESFLQLPNLDEVFRTVTVRFIVEGQEDTLVTLNLGESLSMDMIPSVNVEADSEYNWKVISPIQTKVLGMGEIIADEYLTEEALNNILFDQCYEVNFKLKETVIQGTEKNSNNLACVLAEGTFAKNTTIELADMMNNEIEVNGKPIFGAQTVTLSKGGVIKLHYLIPSDVDSNAVLLYVQNESGEWSQREFVVDGSYLVFDFADDEVGFGFVKDNSGTLYMILYLAIAIVLLVPLVSNILVSKMFRRK